MKWTKYLGDAPGAVVKDAHRLTAVTGQRRYRLCAIQHMRYGIVRAEINWAKTRLQICSCCGTELQRGYCLWSEFTNVQDIFP